MIVSKARKHGVSKLHSKLDYIVLKKPSLHIKRKFLKFAPIKANKNILQMCLQNTRKDCEGLVNVILGAAVPLNLCMLMRKLLRRNYLLGLLFYELGMADGILSQTYSYCPNMVTIGCDVDSNALLRYNST